MLLLRNRDSYLCLPYFLTLGAFNCLVMSKTLPLLTFILNSIKQKSAMSPLVRGFFIWSNKICYSADLIQSPSSNN